jgi:hypothetical protein
VVANLDIYFRFLEDVQDDRCLTLSTVILKNREHQAGERGEYAQQRFFLQVNKGTLSQVDGKSLNSRPQALSTIIESLPSTSHGRAMYVNIMPT